MQAFYRHLAAGQSKAAALRAAKLELLGDHSTSAPRYWAPFILLGEADTSVPLSGLPWWRRINRAWFFGVGLTLIGLGALFRRRRNILRSTNGHRPEWSGSMNIQRRSRRRF
jgi:hypothetical protein